MRIQYVSYMLELLVIVNLNGYAQDRNVQMGLNKAITKIWVGTENSGWQTNANWSPSGKPTENDNVIIPIANVYPIITAIQTINSLTIHEKASLTIDPVPDGRDIPGVARLTVENFILNGSLTINNHRVSSLNSSSLIVNGTLIMNAGSSLINSRGSLITATGNITYNLALDTDWHLVASPVNGQDIDDFVTASDLQVNNNNIALGSYITGENSDSWSYYQNGTSNTDTFNTGQGYSVKLQTAGAISFKGEMKTGDVCIPLRTLGSGYNLVGNPYVSYINSADILFSNTTSLASETIWLWNQDRYQTKVASQNFQIAPGQGFFVQSDGEAGTILIDESFKNHQETNTFLRNVSANAEILLTVTDETRIKQTELYYTAGTTTGFDNGYDGPMFASGNNDFSLYTHLVTNSEGEDFAIQSLPNSDFENMIVPVGVNAIAGTEITFSADVSNFPLDIKVYLEDKLNNCFTRLGGINAVYSISLTENLNGIGRFYLHTARILDTINVALTNTNIYTTNKNNLRIIGIQNETAKVKIYSILGKQTLETSLKGKEINDIALPNLKKGIYIVQLQLKSRKLIKKIVQI